MTLSNGLLTLVRGFKVFWFFCRKGIFVFRSKSQKGKKVTQQAPLPNERNSTRWCSSTNIQERESCFPTYTSVTCTFSSPNYPIIFCSNVCSTTGTKINGKPKTKKTANMNKLSGRIAKHTHTVQNRLLNRIVDKIMLIERTLKNTYCPCNE